MEAHKWSQAGFLPLRLFSLRADSYSWLDPSMPHTMTWIRLPERFHQATLLSMLTLQQFPLCLFSSLFAFIFSSSFTVSISRLLTTFSDCSPSDTNDLLAGGIDKLTPLQLSSQALASHIPLHLEKHQITRLWRPTPRICFDMRLILKIKAPKVQDDANVLSPR